MNAIRSICRLVGLLALTWVSAGHAQILDLPSVGRAVMQQADSAAAPAGDVKADKSGTNPVNFQNTFVVWNEYVDLGDAYTNSTYFDLRLPLQGNAVQWRTRIPMTTSDVSGETEFGLGDISTRLIKTISLTRKDAWVVGLEAWFDTASADSLGSGKTMLGPVVYYVMFLPNKTIFAPAYQQKFSVAGDDSRADVNLGLIDLYYVKMLGVGKTWVVLDPAVIIDYENDNNIGCIFKVIYGMMTGPGTSLYIKPGVGFGDQPVDFSLETGFQWVF